MHSRKFTKMMRAALAMTLVSSLALSACSTKTEETSETGAEPAEQTEVIETAEDTDATDYTDSTDSTVDEYTDQSYIGTTEVTAPEVAIDLVNDEYISILHEYESNIKLVEDDQYAAMPVCNYIDITGDDIPELIIQYAADEENGYEANSDYFMTGAVKVFTYDAMAQEAVEMLHVENTILNAGGGFYTDVVTLSNGNLIVTTGWSDENSEYFITEYEPDGNRYEQVNELYRSEVYEESSDQEFTSTYSYELNGSEIDEDTYNSELNNYIASFTGVLESNPFYDEEWYGENDWAVAVRSTNSSAQNYDDLMAELGG